MSVIKNYYIRCKLLYEKPMIKRICAVIVTHNTGERIAETLHCAMREVDFCMVVDNASTDQTRALVRDFISEHGAHRLEMIEHPINNLASAQNVGICRAREQGYDWVLLLDHDSIVTAGMVETMKSAYRKHPSYEKIAMVVPNLADKFSRRPARYARLWLNFFPIRSGFGRHETLDNVMLAIASGSLIPMFLFDAIGLMDETLCIDNVDYDFCLRILRAGHSIMAVRGAVLHHALGHCADHHIAGMRVTTTNHSPMRRYYIYRNRLRLWRKHGAAIPAYVVLDSCAIIYDLFKIVVFEAQKRAKFRAIFSGIRAACFKSRGKQMLPAEVSALIRGKQ